MPTGVEPAELASWAHRALDQMATDDPTPVYFSMTGGAGTAALWAWHAASEIGIHRLDVEAALEPPPSDHRRRSTRLRFIRRRVLHASAARRCQRRPGRGNDGTPGRHRRLWWEVRSLDPRRLIGSRCAAHRLRSCWPSGVDPMNTSSYRRATRLSWRHGKRSRAKSNSSGPGRKVWNGSNQPIWAPVCGKPTLETWNHYNSLAACGVRSACWQWNG